MQILLAFGQKRTLTKVQRWYFYNEFSDAVKDGSANGYHFQAKISMHLHHRQMSASRASGSHVESSLEPCKTVHNKKIRSSNVDSAVQKKRKPLQPKLVVKLDLHCVLRTLVELLFERCFCGYKLVLSCQQQLCALGWLIFHSSVGFCHKMTYCLVFFAFSVLLEMVVLGSVCALVVPAELRVSIICGACTQPM